MHYHFLLQCLEVVDDKGEIIWDSEKPDGTKYFPARIITKTKIFDKQKDKKLDIIPGMQASVELQGDKRTVLDYLLTPIKKLQREAFTEM